MTQQLSEDEQTILIIKGAIASLPPDQAEACNEVADHIRRVIKQAGEGVGAMALALVGAEYQTKDK